MSFSPKVPDRAIRVSFYDNDGVRVDNVTKKQAKVIAEASPGKLFYFQDKNGLQRELTIAQVLALKPEKDLISNTAYSNAGCPTEPQRCGPPKVQFFGGEGVGAMANAVISPISSGVMAFDIVNPGKKYKEPPIAVLEDECGKGSGSSLKVVMNGDKVRNIIIDAPGDGYLNTFDGSLGGNGRTWKEVDEGYVKTKQGTFYTVPDDRKPPRLGPGDTWYPPFGPPTVEPEPPVVPPVEPVPPTIPPVAPVPPVVPPVEPVPPVVPPPVEPVAPAPGPAPVPSPSSPTYKVLICFDGVVIDDLGFGYKPGDRITITPDNGTVLRPIVNSRGEIATVEIVSKGCGFDDLPQIVVESQTGFNAVIRPILNATRLDEEQLFEVPPDTKLVSVVDCVGIIPPKTTFDRVPR